MTTRKTRAKPAPIVQLVVRLPLDQREAFAAYCKGRDLSASQVLRRCIRDLLEGDQA